jgi:hypothetical protein
VIERPEGGVGEPLVVLVDLLGAQRHGVELESVFDDGVEIGVGHARPAHPRALIAAQDRLESGDQSTGASLPAGGAVGKPFQVDGQAVRYDDELSLPGHGVTGRRSKCAVRKG